EFRPPACSRGRDCSSACEIASCPWSVSSPTALRNARRTMSKNYAARQIAASLCGRCNRCQCSHRLPGQSRRCGESSARGVVRRGGLVVPSGSRRRKRLTQGETRVRANLRPLDIPLANRVAHEPLTGRQLGAASLPFDEHDAPQIALVQPVEYDEVHGPAEELCVLRI